MEFVAWMSSAGVEADKAEVVILPDGETGEVDPIWSRRFGSVVWNGPEKLAAVLNTRLEYSGWKVVGDWKPCQGGAVTVVRPCEPYNLWVIADAFAPVVAAVVRLDHPECGNSQCGICRALWEDCPYMAAGQMLGERAPYLDALTEGNGRILSMIRHGSTGWPIDLEPYTAQITPSTWLCPLCGTSTPGTALEPAVNCNNCTPEEKK